MSGSIDELFMRRALRLASLSLGMTWPNPGVGCVLVKDGGIIGEGRHQICGELHAETAALADCRARGNDPTGATVYITLAPCTRHGRQPPCVEALVAARVGAVIAAADDPQQDDPWLWFEKAGIAYSVGFLRQEAEHVHGGFLTRMRQGRPRFTGKWAITLDGSLAAMSGDSRWISSPEALALSRRRRRAFDAILIGSGTAQRDDPRLAANGARLHGSDRGPVRVVVGRDPELSCGAQLMRSARDQPLLVACAPLPVVQSEALSAAGVATLPLADPHDVEQLAIALGDLGLNEVLVEGGATVHGAYLRAGLYDRLEIYLGARTLGGGLPPALGLGAGSVAEARTWELEEPPRVLGDTVLLRWRSKPL